MPLEPLIGQIVPYAFNFPPRGWSTCEGQLISIASNTALFSLLGVQYGGNGQTTFGLPDLRGRAPLSQGQGPGLSSRTMGEKSGVENVTLLTNQMPLHGHPGNGVSVPLPCFSTAGSADSPAEAVLAAASEEIFSGTSNNNMGAATASTVIGNAGGSSPHSNLPPTLALNFCIATQGIFPSRN
ncbi:MAG: phage tail protein [Akkermansiaceae bacterium]|nr:phage tail protein [Akkermansiaceae bacterium]